MPLSREQPVTACNVLLGLIEHSLVRIPDERQRTNALALALIDLASKIRNLPEEIAIQFYQRAKQLVGSNLIEAYDVLEAAVEHHRTLTAEDDTSERVMRPTADAVIVTVIQAEFEAALRIFGIDSQTARRQFELRGRDRIPRDRWRS